MDDNTSTPAEFVKLRDQLALDLAATVGDPAQCRRSAEYLLASGLVPLSTIRARYDETHPATKGDGAEPEPEPEPEPGADPWLGIEVGTEVEYVGGLSGYRTSPDRIGRTGTVAKVHDYNKGDDDDSVNVSGMGFTYLRNLRRVS